MDKKPTELTSSPLNASITTQDSAAWRETNPINDDEAILPPNLLDITQESSFAESSYANDSELLDGDKLSYILQNYYLARDNNNLELEENLFDELGSLVNKIIKEKNNNLICEIFYTQPNLLNFVNLDNLDQDLKITIADAMENEGRFDKDHMYWIAENCIKYGIFDIGDIREILMEWAHDGDDARRAMADLKGIKKLEKCNKPYIVNSGLRSEASSYCVENSLNASTTSDYDRSSLLNQSIASSIDDPGYFLERNINPNYNASENQIVAEEGHLEEELEAILPDYISGPRASTPIPKNQHHEPKTSRPSSVTSPTRNSESFVSRYKSDTSQYLD